MNKTDPVTLEVIRNALEMIADTMALVLMRSAYSSVVRDSMDYSTALFDAKGRMIAQGLTTALHLGSFPVAIAELTRAYEDRIHPDDVFITNDPYGAGGMHLPDIYLTLPIFFAGVLEGFAVALVHHADVGGIAPGSNTSFSTEIYQEGLRIPLVKLYDRGTPNDTVFKFIEKNVRVPVEVAGDMRAQLAACRQAEQAYMQLLEKYGSDSLGHYLNQLLELAERMMREEIQAIPDGSYEFTDFIDGLGSEPEPIRFQVTITIAGEEAVVDWSGSAPQVKGGINAPFPMTLSASYLAFRCLGGRDIPNNEGYMRPIRVLAPEGTIMNPVLPAACSTRGITGFRMLDTLLGALAGAVPDRVPAAGEGGATFPSIGGYHEGEPFVFTESVLGCSGGRPDRDGAEGVPNPGANQSNQPVELIEARHPIEILQYGLVMDSGGPGKYRGGLALMREYRILAEEAVLSMRSDRRAHPPYGLQGGLSGSPTCNTLYSGLNQSLLPVLPSEAIVLRKGEILRHLQAGGGGWGTPVERNPQMVLEDARNDKVSLEQAREVYGVVIDPLTLSMDEEATATTRQRMLAAGEHENRASADLSAEDLSRIPSRAALAGRVSSKEMADRVASFHVVGSEVLSLKGSPAWPPPEHVLAAAEQAIGENAMAPSNGFPELRKAIAARWETDDGIRPDSDTEILITHGAMHAMSIAFLALLAPGDEVLMFSPGFQFGGPLHLAGAVAVCVPTHQEQNWRWDLEAMEAACSSRTRMVILNSPGNPTGYVASKRDLEAAAELALRHNLLILSDECYDKMVYDGRKHLRAASIPEIRDRLLTLCSFTKSYAMQPWRLGYIVGPPDLIAACRKVLEWNVLTCSHIAQRAAQAALEGPQDWVHEIARRYQQYRDLMIEGLDRAPGISFAVPAGAPFLFLNIRGLGLPSAEFAEALLSEYGVAVEPGGPYGSGDHVRLMFGGTEKTIQEAANRFRKIVGNLALSGQ